MKLCARCDWEPGEPEDGGSWAQWELRELLEDHAAAAEHPLCIKCRRRSLEDFEKQVCGECLEVVRGHLRDVVAWWIELRGHLGHVVGQAYDASRGKDTVLPGGDVLVLLAGGSAGESENHETRNPDDAPSVAFLLSSWERTWREQRGESEAGRDVSQRGLGRVVYAASGYLERHALWASSNVDGFDRYAQELADLHGRLEIATGRARQPMKTGATCLVADCGGRLVWPVDRETGLQTDTLRCPRCGSRSNLPQYLMAQRATRDAQLDGWLSVTDAAAASYRTIQTIATWARTGDVESARWCNTCKAEVPWGPLTARESTHLHRTLVWWPDVDAKTKAAERRAPRPRKAATS